MTILSIVSQAGRLRGGSYAHFPQEIRAIVFARKDKTSGLKNLFFKLHPPHIFLHIFLEK